MGPAGRFRSRPQVSLPPHPHPLQCLLKWLTTRMEKWTKLCEDEIKLAEGRTAVGGAPSAQPYAKTGSFRAPSGLSPARSHDAASSDLHATLTKEMKATTAAMDLLTQVCCFPVCVPGCGSC